MNVQPTQVAYATPQPATYVVQAPNVAFVNSGANPAESYKSTFKGVGIAQVTIGCLCFILGIVVFIMIGSSTGAGIWGGLSYVVSGSLAIASGTNPNHCNVTAGLVLSILATIVAFVAMIIDAIASTGFSLLGVPSLAAIHGILAFLSFAEFVIAIVHSAFCCKANCGRPTQTAVIATTAMTAVPMHQTQHVPPYTPEKM